jgi:peptide/nickel transport system substrate-binding protein
MRNWILFLGLVLLSACSAGRTLDSGVLHFDLAADPSTLNPLFLHADAASVEQQLARLSFEPFVDLDAAGRPVPALLAVIPSRANGGLSADGRTIVYHLRPNVLWSDGIAVTSDDVLYTLHAILDPRNPVRSREGYELIDRATAPDAHTAIFHLSRAWAPAVMTYFSYGFSPQFVLPAHVLRKQGPLAQDDFNQNPSVGDGPYRFVSWTRGESLQYVANTRYWRGTPAIARLDIRTVADPSTNLVMMQSGRLDWNLIAPVQLENLEGSPGIAFTSTPTAVVAGLALNTAHAPLNDAGFRRALAMSIDRSSMSRKITLGKYPVTDMLQPQFSWAYDASVHEPTYDPSAADAAFDAAGWRRGTDGMRARNGVPLRLVYVQFPESTTGVRVATTVQAELRSRGIDVELKSISNAQLFLPKTGALAMGAFDLAYVPWTMGADPDDSSVLGCNAASNYMRWCDSRVDAFEKRALVATSQAERKSIYSQIAHIVAEQVPVIYLFNAQYIYAYQARLHGFAPNAFLPTWNAGSWKLRVPARSAK